MRAISLWQPWAELCVLGEKKFETRDWPTKVTGTVYVHAAKRWTKAEQQFLAYPYFKQVLMGETLAFGAIIGTVDILGCCPTENICHRIDEQELMFGDWAAGRFAWHLGNPVRFEEPIPWKGSQGFFDVDLKQVRS